MTHEPHYDIETTKHDWISAPPHTRVVTLDGAKHKWCDLCKQYCEWSKFPVRPEVSLGIDAECQDCQPKRAKMPEPHYEIPAGFFDGYDPNSDEWCCEPEELEAYPGVALRRCTICMEQKETYRDFNRERHGKYGRRAECRDCQQVRKRQRTAESIQD